jgi:hypothetical protein
MRGMGCVLNAPLSAELDRTLSAHGGDSLEFGDDPAFDMCDHTLLGGLQLLHWTTTQSRGMRDDDSTFAAFF